MPLCGFNQKMLEGLLSFHEGLVESVLNKSSVSEKKLESSSQEEK